jgi:hypothetical protein
MKIFVVVTISLIAIAVATELVAKLAGSAWQ